MYKNIAFIDRKDAVSYEEINRFLNHNKTKLDEAIREYPIQPEAIKYYLGRIDSLEMLMEQHTSSWEKELKLSDPFYNNANSRLSRDADC